MNNFSVFENLFGNPVILYIVPEFLCNSRNVFESFTESNYLQYCRLSTGKDMKRCRKITGKHTGEEKIEEETKKKV